MDYQRLLEKAKKESPTVSQDKGRFEIPLAKGHIQGTKTIITNIQQIADQIDRPIEHLLKYLLKELATPGDIKENGSLILGRKIASEEFNSKIKKYSEEFVFCKECKKPDTKFKKENDVISIQCMVCGAKYTKQG
jgi:translation initiation factor 2 subunit 2